MFQNGHKIRHDNHKGGRPTKEQEAELYGLLPLAMKNYREILTNENKNIQWMNLKERAAKNILDKFIPTLTQDTGEWKKNLNERIETYFRAVETTCFELPRPGDSNTSTMQGQS